MTVTIRHATSSALRHLVPVAAIASALALGLPAIANAADEWDIGAYDACMKRPHGPGTGNPDETEYTRYCCFISNGVWNGTKCVAPPVNAGEPAPTRTLPGSVPTQILVPGNPPPANNAGG